VDNIRPGRALAWAPMADERDDPWSAGVTAEKPEPTWPPQATDDGADDTSRLHTGRWMSPSLGAYDPDSRHRALDDDGADDAYFSQFGYGESFGDGRLAAGYDSAPPPQPAASSPPPAPAGADPARMRGEAPSPDERVADAPSFDPAAFDPASSDSASGDGPSVAPRSFEEPSPVTGSSEGPSSWNDPAWGPPAAPSHRGDRPGPAIGGDRRPEAGSPLDRSGVARSEAGGGDRSDVLDPDGGEADGEDGNTADDSRRNLIEWGVVLVGAVLLALVLRALVLQAFWIPSPSMETTLLVRDRVLVNKVSYHLHDINRGDVVVFRRTDEEIAQNPELPHDVIKRVIALGGETIEIRDNEVFIDGLLLQEPYLDEGVITSDYGPDTVPEGHIFVMGDNRELSLDSRFETGPVAEDRVVGRAFLLFWPLNRIGAL
jgi:signal peptidase I